MAAAGTAAAVQAAPTNPSPDAAQARSSAAKSADSLVASRPKYLHASSEDKFIQRAVMSSAGLQYVSYDRTYKDLPVIGGDFVVVTDSRGQTRYTSVAQQQGIANLSTTPRLSSADAEKTARGQLHTVSGVEGTKLVVYALDGAAKLAWESTVDGTDAEGPSRLTVDVDATTGAVLHTQEHVTEATGTGNGWIYGSVSVNTTQSGSTFSLKDPSETNLSCQDAANNTTFSGPDNVWGNGNGTSKETGCVDALFAAQSQTKMLSQWLGRNAQDGSGGAWPLRVGLNQQNAYYDGTQVQIGKNTAGQWISSADVVGHELGHGIDDHTPGGVSGSGTQEFVADTWGAATEWFINNPNDPPDYTVGEEINLTGSGPIRTMYDPSKNGHDNCYSSRVPSEEVHAAAGPGNHWFYLMAEGNHPTDGQPTSPTCNNSNVTGIGIQNAIKVMYNAMLMKTSGASYLKYRTWTLQAAKNLFPNGCTEFNSVKAAWDAVSVPTQSGDPTCSGGPGPSPSPTATPTPPPSGGCSGQKLANPGFESGSTSWTASSGVIGQYGSQGEPAHAGTWSAWMDGYGTSHTDTVSQSVSIPAGCHATLTFWLHIDTSETTSTTAYDKLTVRAGSATVATFSNVDKTSGYVQKSYDLSAQAGQTVTVTFTGTEDGSAQTSFVLDDTGLTLS